MKSKDMIVGTDDPILVTGAAGFIGNSRAAEKYPEPVMKTIAETWKSTLRPNRSPNLPTSTVATVSARRYAVTTHDMCAAPPRSDTIVGSAVPTIVWSSAASSMPSMIVTKTTLRRRRSSTGGCAGGCTVSVVVVTRTASHRERVRA